MSCVGIGGKIGGQAGDGGVRPANRSWSMAWQMVPGVVMAIAVSALSLGFSLGVKGATGPRAVIFPPWLDRGEVWLRVASAQGTIAREGRWPFVVVVDALSEDFSDRIHAAGAWFEVDPKVVADCSGDSGESNRAQ